MPKFTRLKPSLALRLLSKGLFYIRDMLPTNKNKSVTQWGQILFLQSHHNYLYDVTVKKYVNKACAFNLSNYDWMSRKPKGGQATTWKCNKMQQNLTKIYTRCMIKKVLIIWHIFAIESPRFTFLRRVPKNLIILNNPWSWYRSG